MKIFLYIILFFQLVYANDMYYCYGDKNISLTPVTNLSRSLSSIDYYEDENGHLLGVTDKLIVVLKDSINANIVLTQYNLHIVSKLSHNSYLLKVDDKNMTITIANKIQELPEVLYAHPDFIKKRFKR